MSAYGLALDRCLQQLVRLGKKHGGYVTYQILLNVLHDEQCDVSIEALDWICERLAAEGIELVDQLPGKLVTNIQWQDNRGGIRQHRHRTEVARRKPRYRWDCDFVLDSDWTDYTLCPEDAVDELWFRAETGLLRSEELLAIIEDCHLSSVEVDQLVEYLWSKGIDFPNVNMAQLSNSISDGRETCDGEEQDSFLFEPSVQILLREINHLEKLTASKEQKLARLAKGGDPEAVRCLVEANLLHVFKLATNYIGRGLDLLDLVQEGSVGLMKAVRKFDWRRGNRLSAYSSFWIYQAISRAITDHARLIRLPAHLSETLERVLKTADNLYCFYGREPTAGEIALEMGLAERQVRKLQALSQPIVSWEVVMAEWEEADVYPERFLQEYTVPPPDAKLTEYLLREAVAEVLAELKPREQQVLRLRFGFDGDHPHTLGEVAEYFGLTRERIRQIESKALKKLKHPRRRNKLRDFLV